MREKLKELSEILKQNTAIKERLERLEFGCWICNHIILDNDGYSRIIEIYPNSKRYGLIYENGVQNSHYGEFKYILGREPQYSDILEYLGEGDLGYGYYISSKEIGQLSRDWGGWGDNYGRIEISPGALSEQSDETLNEIISLCKNVGTKNG